MGAGGALGFEFSFSIFISFSCVEFVGERDEDANGRQR